MTTLIVNASSKSKRSQCNEPFSYDAHPFHTRLGKQNASKFIKARHHILKQFHLDTGPDIDEGRADAKDGEYLPAYLRYSGRTYSKISDEAWKSLIANDGEYDMVILSALYGFVRYNEPVREYEVKQVTPMGDTKIGYFWRDTGAKEWLLDYIKHNNITKVLFVLSKSYSDIIRKKELMKELELMGIEAEDRQMKAKGMASMLERGKYINELLLSI